MLSDIHDVIELLKALSILDDLNKRAPKTNRKIEHPTFDQVFKMGPKKFREQMRMYQDDFTR
jgi:hypothetical protein